MAEPGQGDDGVKNLQRRVERLESKKATAEDFQLLMVDEDLPDGRMFYKGQPVIVLPAEYTLIVHKQARRKIDA